MNTRMRVAFGAVAVAVVGTTMLLVQNGIGAPEAIPSQSQSVGQSVSAEPSPSIPFAITGPVSGPGSTPLDPGTYRMRWPGFSPVGWPKSVVVTIPNQWYAVSAVRGAGLVKTEDFRVARLNFSSVGNLVADPCTGGEARGPMLVPPLGSSVDELAAGLRALPGLGFTEPVDTTLDGWAGKRLEQTTPAVCGDSLLWLTPPDGGETWEIYIREGWHSTYWILDIEGLRFAVVASYEVTAPIDVQMELQQMVNSIDIEP